MFGRPVGNLVLRELRCTQSLSQKQTGQHLAQVARSMRSSTAVMMSSSLSSSSTDKFREEYNKMREVRTEADWTPTFQPSDELDRDARWNCYDDNAKDYDVDLKNYGYGAPAIAAQAVHQQLNGNADTTKILDVGCGTGLIAQELRMLGAYQNIDGLEPASKMLNIAQSKRLYQKTFNQLFTTETGLDSGAYDVVVTAGTFMPNHIESAAVKEMVRLIRPGGYVVIAMRDKYLTTDEDLSKVLTYITELAESGHIKVVVDRLYEGHFQQRPGRLFVLQKL